jgi:hypothetical protein
VAWQAKARRMRLGIQGDNMTEPPQDTPEVPKIWVGALEFNPQIASLLGIYLADITQFELGLISLFARVSGTSFEIAKAIFGRIMNISTRMDIISDCIQIAPHSAEIQNELSGLVAKARAINSTRNKYVHGTYRVNDLNQSFWPRWLVFRHLRSENRPVG